MSNERRPRPGNLVHYADVQASLVVGRPPEPVCRAAIITEVDQDGSHDLVGLAVVRPNGLSFNPIIRGDREGTGSAFCPGVIYEPTGACECGHFHEPGYELASWHWPHPPDLLNRDEWQHLAEQMKKPPKIWLDPDTMLSIDEFLAHPETGEIRTRPPRKPKDGAA